MTKQTILIGKEYKYLSDMIQAAIKAGFKHVAGGGFACKKCKRKYSARKFLKGRGTLFACNKCRARWGNFIK